MTGTIIRGIGGFYYVQTDSGLWECKARGILRKRGHTPAVGDRVRLAEEGPGLGTIEEILPRLNHFERPPVSNVEAMLLVTSAREPEPDLLLIDLFAVTASRAGAAVILCVNKVDLAEGDSLAALEAIYAPLYPFHLVSGRTGEGLEALRQELLGVQAALTGASGVGKSTLLNALLGREVNPTGEVSRRTSRGRHTTRHVELFVEQGLLLFDTPGFTSFELAAMPPVQLRDCFPEMQPLAEDCRFSDCLHALEPDCAVRAAVEEGSIAPSRYRSYRTLLEDLQAKEDALY